VPHRVDSFCERNRDVSARECSSLAHEGGFDYEDVHAWQTEHRIRPWDLADGSCFQKVIRLAALDDFHNWLIREAA